MTIGIAIVIAMVLYIVDRNKVWKQAAKVLGALALVAILGVAGVVGWVKFDNWQTARKEALAEATLDQERATLGGWYDHLPDCKRVVEGDSMAGKAFVFGKNFVFNGTDMVKTKRDIGSEMVFVSPDNTAAGKSWDSTETVQPCKGVWVRPAPVTLDFSKAQPLKGKNYAWSTTAMTLTSEAVGSGMVVGKLAPDERVEVLESRSYGVKVRTRGGVIGWVYPPGDLTTIATGASK